MDDDLPLNKDDLLGQLAKEDLDPLGLEALDERVERLEAEIDRCKQARAARQSSQAAAEAFFSKP